MFRGLQIPEDKGQSKGRKETDDKVNKGKTIFVPVDLQSTGGITAGLRPARIINPQFSDSGITNPRGLRDYKSANYYLGDLQSPRTKRGQTQTNPRG